MSGSNTIPLGGGGGGGRFASGGGGGGGGSLLNPSYLNQGSVVPLGSNQGERKRPAERESRFDKKESREERSVQSPQWRRVRTGQTHHVSLAGRRRESLGGLTSPARPSSPACPP